MRKAVVKEPFTMIQWHGEDYPYHGEDAEENIFREGDEVLVLHEAKSNPMGKLYVIYSERINESAVVHEDNIEFLDEEED